MKLLITVFLSILVFSLNTTGQSKRDFSNKTFTKNGPNKMISFEVQNGNQLNARISPLLNIFLKRIDKSGGVSVQLSESFSGMKELVYFYKNEFDDILLPVFIKTKNLSATGSSVLAVNGKVSSAAGDIIVADVPVSSIESIANNPDVIYIDASSISELKIDVGRVETKVSQLHSGSGIPRPYKGNGVVVGIIDSGIDWKHLDFKNTSGSRIKFLWDMSASGNPPSGYNYGTEYSKAQLDANQCLEKDLDDGGGHGTHVAGTAAGSGGTSASYMGMAPESDIIFVKGFRTGPGFANTDVVNGCNYIFSKAQQLGKPAVINLSLGGHYGPHDGSSLYEQALSNLTGSGKIIVAAAGNEGGTLKHVGYITGGTNFPESRETFFEIEDGANLVAADLWYNSGTVYTGIACYDPFTFNLIGYTNAIAPGQSIQDMAFTIGSTTYGYVTVDATGVNNPNNGANEVVFVVDSHNGQVNIGNYFWTIYTYGSGTIDAWAFTGGEFSSFTQGLYIPGDNNKTVGQPGTSNNLICVGSHVTKNQWVDIDGITRFQPGNPVIGDISYFSSLGPSRDGRIKPDITAPGEVIVAAYSSDLTQTPRSNILFGGKHQKMQGTSMATPHVTGAIALLLEKNNTLDYAQTVAALKNTAKKDSYTGSSANNVFGSGKMDAYNAFLSITGGGGGVQTANLVYDDGVPTSGYYWGGAGQGSASRMTPTLSNATVTKMEIYFTSINAGNATYQPIILTNNGGQPGVSYTALPLRTAAVVPGWDEIDLTSYSISVNGDFYVGLLYDGVNRPTYGYDPVSNGRAWDYSGSWTSWNETYFMRASIQTLTSTAELSSEIPVDFELSQNYPNPFNPSSSFKLSLPEGRDTKIIVYDIRGSKVAELVNNFLSAGTYEITWNGRNDEGIKVASGTYIYTVKAGDFLTSKKMMLIK
jgi:minor extracellular serine protease Vpr